MVNMLFGCSMNAGIEQPNSLFFFERYFLGFDQPAVLADQDAPADPSASTDLTAPADPPAVHGFSDETHKFNVL